jgi:hypothetical protein
MNRGFIGALCTSVATALLTGCGGSQPAIGAPGAMPQGRAIAQHAARGKSWMLSTAGSEDLIYASLDRENVGVFTFPKAKPVGELTGFAAPTAGLCSDATGNVYVTTLGAYGSTIYEYSHGGTQPIKTLTDPGAANSCAVDPGTGDLAVANYFDGRANGDLATYKNAQGMPSIYADANFTRFLYCTYDNEGNLFADGLEPDNMIAELPYGSDTLTEITLSESIRPLSIQWSNAELNIAQAPNSSRGAQLIYPVQLLGSVGTVGSPVSLLSKGDRRTPGDLQFWIQGNTIIGPGRTPRGGDQRLQAWKYPKGGKPRSSVKADSDVFGVTVSLAPHRQATRSK